MPKSSPRVHQGAPAASGGVDPGGAARTAEAASARAGAGAARDDARRPSTVAPAPIPKPSRGKRRGGPLLRAVTVIPLRVGDDGGLEVIMGQIEVFNALRSTPDHNATMPFSGELRFLGGTAAADEQIPLATAEREIRDIGFPLAEDSHLSAVLFSQVIQHAETRKKVYQVCNFVAPLTDNRAVFDVDISVINRRLAQQREACESLIAQGTFWEIPDRDRMRYSPRLYKIMWIPVAEAVRRLDPSKPHTNEWQREQFVRYGIKRREPAVGTHKLLEGLQRLGSARAIRDASLEVSILGPRAAHSIASDARSDGGFSTDDDGDGGSVGGRSSTSDAGRYARRGRSDSYTAFELAGAGVVGGSADGGGSTADDVRGTAGYTYPASVASAPADGLSVHQNNIVKAELLSYNLNVLPFGADWFASGPGQFTTQRVRAFVNRLRTAEGVNKFDVVALQEVFSTPALPFMCHQRLLLQLAADAGYQWAVTSPQPGISDVVFRRQWTDSGLVILSRYPIEDAHWLEFRDRGVSLDAGAAKGALHARVRVGERQVHVFNCHLQATHTSLGQTPAAKAVIGDSAAEESTKYASVRLNQLRELVTFVEQWSGMDGTPVVLTGDFNIDAVAEAASDDRASLPFFSSEADSAEYRMLMRVLDRTTANGTRAQALVDLLKERHDGHHVSTRPPRVQFPKTPAYAFRHKYPQRLDYVFFRAGGLGEMVADVHSTRIVKFAWDARMDAEEGGAQAGFPRAAAPSVGVATDAMRLGMTDGSAAAARWGLGLLPTPREIPATETSSAAGGRGLDSVSNGDEADGNDADDDAGDGDGDADEPETPTLTSATAPREQGSPAMAPMSLPSPNTPPGGDGGTAGASAPSGADLLDDAPVAAPRRKLSMRRDTSITDGLMQAITADPSARAFSGTSTTASDPPSPATPARRTGLVGSGRMRELARAGFGGPLADTSVSEAGGFGGLHPSDGGSGGGGDGGSAYGGGGGTGNGGGAGSRTHGTGNGLANGGGGRYGGSRSRRQRQARRSGRGDNVYLSDHFGVATTLRAERHIKWDPAWESITQSGVSDSGASAPSSSGGGGSDDPTAAGAVAHASTTLGGSSVGSHFGKPASLVPAPPVTRAAHIDYTLHTTKRLLKGKSYRLWRSALAWMLVVSGIVGAVYLAWFAPVSTDGVHLPQPFRRETPALGDEHVTAWPQSPSLNLTSTIEAIESGVRALQAQASRATGATFVVTTLLAAAVTACGWCLGVGPPVNDHKAGMDRNWTLSLRQRAAKRRAGTSTGGSSNGGNAGRNTSGSVGASGSSAGAQQYVSASEGMHAALAAAQSPPSTPRDGVSASLPGVASPTASAGAVPSVYDGFMRSVEHYGFRRCIAARTLTSDATLGKFEWISYSDAWAQVTAFGSGLAHVSRAARGTRVGIMGGNSSEWIVADLACAAFSLVSVVLHSYGKTDELWHMLRRADVAVLLCSRGWTRPVIEACRAGACPNLKQVVQVGRVEYEEQVLAHDAHMPLCDFQFICAAGHRHPLPHVPPLPSDLASEVFVWDAAGEPRGVPFSHSALAIAVDDFADRMASSRGEGGLSVGLQESRTGPASGRGGAAAGMESRGQSYCSYLPLAYMPERVAVHACLRCGMSIGIFGGTSTSSLFDHIRQLQPSFLLATTHMLEHLHRQFRNVHRGWSWLYRVLFAAAYDAKVRELRTGKSNFVSRFWGDRFVLRAIAYLLSDSVRFLLVVGHGTPLNPRTEEMVQVVLRRPVGHALLVPEAAGIAMVGLRQRYQDADVGGPQAPPSKTSGDAGAQAAEAAVKHASAFPFDVRVATVGPALYPVASVETRIAPLRLVSSEAHASRSPGGVCSQPVVPSLGALGAARARLSAGGDVRLMGFESQYFVEGELLIRGGALRRDVPTEGTRNRGGSGSGGTGGRSGSGGGSSGRVGGDSRDEGAVTSGRDAAAHASVAGDVLPIAGLGGPAHAAHAHRSASGSSAADGEGNEFVGWSATGIIVRTPKAAAGRLLDAEGAFYVLGHKSSLLRLPHGKWALAQRLERLYRHSCVLVKQMWCYAHPGLPMVAVCVAEHEQCYHFARWYHGGRVPVDIASLCTQPGIMEKVLDDIHRTAESLSLDSAHRVCAVHLTPVEFHPRTGLATPTEELRRDRLLEYFRVDIEAMYAQLGHAPKL